ncbi:MAG: murein biosynthesis integral membrane protein MurJ [Firmicutes bacterium]|nr:murein biosynthesis integral membrane protein MurJ [Bacillota bacterium]
MTAITFAGKLLGLVRESVIYARLGTASLEAAAVNYATMLPNQFMDVMFAAVVTASFIPVFNLVMQKRGKNEAFEMSYRFISLILLVSAAVTAVLTLLAGPVISSYDGGRTPGVLRLGTTLLRVMLPIIVISCAAFSLTGILQSLGEFNIPAAMALVSNSVILVYLIFFLDRFGVTGLCAAFLLGWAAQLLMQIPFLLKNGFKFKFRLPSPAKIRRDGDFREIGLLAVPVLVSTWVAPVNLIVNGKAALQSAYGSQAMVTLARANTLYAVLAGVLVLSVSNLIFPKLSALAANDEAEAFGAALKQALRALLYLLIPMALGLMAVSRPLIRLYLERGSFDALSTSLTSSALTCFAAGMPGFGLQTVLARGFYARREGKTPLYTGLAAMAVNLGLSFLLVRFMRGASGPALASSVSVSVVAGLMLWRMGRRNRYALDRKMLVDALKMLIAGGVMFGAAVLTGAGVRALGAGGLLGRILAVVLPVLAGIAVYFPLTAAMRLEEARTAWKMVGNKKRGLTCTKS